MKFIRLLAALLFPVLLCAADNPLEKGNQVLVLDPMMIRSVPIGSYAIEIGIKINPDTKKVDRMFVTGVRENTDAEDAGLQPGDEILKLDGRSVQEFDGSLRKDGPLSRILIDRDFGEPLKLEILVRRKQTFTLRAQPRSGP
jgi:predicted metalloprotease with PDZ domain